MQLRILTYSLLLLVISSTHSQAQISDTSYNGVNDPLSAYGLGTVIFDGQQSSGMMGHTGAAHQSAMVLNNANPASISKMRVSTLDFSLQGINSRAIGTDQNQKSGAFTPSYFYLTLPVGKKGGMSMGIDQKMSTLYRISSLQQTSVEDSFLMTEQKWLGRGSLSYITLGGAYQWKDFSLGLRVDYNFGNQQTENFILFTDSVQIFGSDYLRNIQYRGLSTRLGLQYSKYINFDSTQKVSAGIAFEPRSNISAKEISVEKSFFGRTNFQVGEQDTFYSSNTGRGNYNAPYSIRLGIGYVLRDKLEALMDYSYIDFRKSTLFDDSLSLGTFQKFSAGLNFTPSIEPGKSTFSLTTYYAGFYFGRDYFQAQGHPVRFWGITSGLSIPFSRNLGKLHLGIEYGARGNVDDNLIKINNTIFTFGVSFSDIWFRKRYYD